MSQFKIGMAIRPFQVIFIGNADVLPKSTDERLSMFATLMIPSPDGVAQTFTLRLEFRDGHPVFVSSHGHVIEASYFRLMRDRMGASIETDQAPLVAKVLHVAEDEAGLVAVN